MHKGYREAVWCPQGWEAVGGSVKSLRVQKVGTDLVKDHTTWNCIHTFSSDPSTESGW